MNNVTETQRTLLLLMAIFGLVVPNGAFVYLSITRWDLVVAAMTNPIALVFIVEAFALMFFFAWLIHRQGLKAPGGLAFIIMSLVGSMMFGVPACLWLWSRKSRQSLSVK